MSSHREAPEISKDPVADNTDVYAFVSPDQPNTVTIIANFIPLEHPAGGPNFFEFGDDVLYELHVDNDGDGTAEIIYRFRFQTTLQNPDTFLYNTGPIGSLTDPNWNKRQTYTVSRVMGMKENATETVLATGLPCPPCNIGPLSTPNYAALAQAAVNTLSSGEVVFAGQRAEGFYVDLGAVFDLADLRPFENLHVGSMLPPNGAGVNASNGFNVHSIALQVPKTMLTSDGSNPTDPTSPLSVVGIWATASRQSVRVIEAGQGGGHVYGPFVQVSRLGNPLFNEVIVPLGQKNYWNAVPPVEDSQFAQYVETPELQKLLPVLYPGVFPNLATITGPRADLVAILLTGIPSGIINGFQNYTGSVQADMLRLNMAIPPSSNPNILGVVGGDLAGFPNGRRVQDDVVTIELRAIAGLTYPLVNSSYTPDGAASLVTDGLTPANVKAPYLANFPYLGVPYDGFDYPYPTL